MFESSEFFFFVFCDLCPVFFSPQRVMADYRLTAFLGKGSFGRVFRAEHVATKKELALKMVPNESQWEAAREEAAIMRKFIGHPHILQLTNIKEEVTYPHFDGPSHNRPVFCMEVELACGNLLSLLIGCGKFNQRLARTCFRQLVAAVDTCHRVRRLASGLGRFFFFLFSGSMLYFLFVLVRLQFTF
jgi:serine/threonine protein kinase